MEESGLKNVMVLRVNICGGGVSTLAVIRFINCDILRSSRKSEMAFVFD